MIEARIKAKAGRTKEELSGHVTYAVDAILRLVEQGVKVEIRLVPPPPEKDTEERPEFEQLRKIVPQLVFPEVEGPPILGLPAPPKDRG